MLHAHIDASLDELIDHLIDPLAMVLRSCGAPDPGEIVVSLIERPLVLVINDGALF
jgi:hypothetical protein